MNRLETDVEDFLPDYYLPDHEGERPGKGIFPSLYIVAGLAAVCGLSVFFWSIMISGNPLVVAGGEGNNKGQISAPGLLSDVSHVFSDDRRAANTFQ
ncbi:MAG: hypothetical protein DSY50_06790 [Desulfobulbus sp.]|nr:MAG: hypothetical protein DSY50_06790 [Desulfobulbus sp.]